MCNTFDVVHGLKSQLITLHELKSLINLAEICVLKKSAADCVSVSYEMVTFIVV